MNAADLRCKAMDMLAESTRAIMNGESDPADWIAAIDEADSLMASARKAEAEELAELERRWAQIAKRVDSTSRLVRACDIACGVFIGIGLMILPKVPL